MQKYIKYHFCENYVKQFVSIIFIAIFEHMLYLSGGKKHHIYTIRYCYSDYQGVF